MNNNVTIIFFIYIIIPFTTKYLVENTIRKNKFRNEKLLL